MYVAAFCDPETEIFMRQSAAFIKYFEEVSKRGKKAQIIYSPVYTSCIDLNHYFYDCAYGKCHLFVFYQFYCT